MLNTKIVSAACTSLVEWKYVNVLRPGNAEWALWLEEAAACGDTPFALLVGEVADQKVAVGINPGSVCYITNHNGKTVDIVKEIK